jgi:hypothetical protein
MGRLEIVIEEQPRNAATDEGFLMDNAYQCINWQEPLTRPSGAVADT